MAQKWQSTPKEYWNPTFNFILNIEDYTSLFVVFLKTIFIEFKTILVLVTFQIVNDNVLNYILVCFLFLNICQCYIT